MELAALAAFHWLVLPLLHQGWLQRSALAGWPPPLGSTHVWLAALAAAFSQRQVC